jgi:hypothetical protein
MKEKVRLMVRLLVLIAMTTMLSACLYQSIGKSTGAFLDPVKGYQFVHISNDEWDSSKDALIYFYRPHSKWASEEIESPDVYVDGKPYFNIRDGSFTWLEVYPGIRRIQIRRPLLGIEGLGDITLSMIADKKLKVEAGKVYYLRYSEVKPPEGVNNEISPDSKWAQGDLQLVTRDVAMKDIIGTRYLKPDALAPNHAGRSIVEINRSYDYKEKKAQLEVIRKEEIAKLKSQKKWIDAPWYWPFGKKEHPPLQADKELAALEKARKQHIADLEAKKPHKKWYWPF